MIKKTLALVATLASLALAQSAAASCADWWLDIDAENTAEGMQFEASNLGDVPITFTMKFSLWRYAPSRHTTFTETLQPGESRPVMSLKNTGRKSGGRYDYRTRCTVGNKDADHDDDVLYQLPYAAGKSYRVLQGYFSRFSHTGREAYAVDFNMPEGTPVHAARDGIVASTEERHSIGCWEDGCGRYANYIIIVHDDDTTGEYYHLQQDGVLVERGDRVVAGQLIGLSGNTGHSTMPHLHFGVYRAIDWGREQSIPVRFSSAKGIIDRPRSGGHYLATAAPDRLGGNDNDGESGGGDRGDADSNDAGRPTAELN